MNLNIIEGLREEDIIELYDSILSVDKALVGWVSTNFYCEASCICPDAHQTISYFFNSWDATGIYSHKTGWGTHGCGGSYYAGHTGISGICLLLQKIHNIKTDKLSQFTNWHFCFKYCLYILAFSIFLAHILQYLQAVSQFAAQR